MPPAPGGYLVVKTTFEDLIERDDFPKATEAMISFTVIEMSEPPVFVEEFGVFLPAFVNLTATYMLSFDDGSSLAMLGTENTSVFTGESTQIWAVVGGTQKMMGATGEGTAICAPTNPTDPTSTVCTFEGQVCL